jgi:serine phosphatase RsbU (regulator of sigma subunit)/tetratricopeptide (TPR) repeat protein
MVNEPTRFIFRFLFIALISSFSTAGFLQSKIDSLNSAFNKTNQPLVKYKLQQEIGWYYFDKKNYDSAAVAMQQAITLVPKNNTSQKGEAYYNLARVYHSIEDMNATILNFGQSYRLHKAGKSDPNIIADVAKELGRAFYDIAQYDSAMVYYMISKDIYEDNGIENIHYAALYHYIGSVFKRQNNMDKACEYYQLEIALGEKINDLSVIAEGSYLYSECIENDTLRLAHDFKVLAYYKELNFPRGVALLYHNISMGYQTIKMLDSAYHYNMLSLEISRKQGSKSIISSTLANIGRLLLEMERYREAEKYLVEAEQLALASDLKKYLRLQEIYDSFYKIHYAKGNFKKATDYLLLMHKYKDLASDEAHQDAIHEMELAYQTEKKEAEIELLQIDSDLKEQETKVAQAEAARESSNKKVFMFSGLGMLIIALFALFKWRESIKGRRIINDQKILAELQKDVIEQKNKDMIDSMIYASSIQQAIITSQEYISTMFNDFFVFYKPRDIVSGDFYWAYQTHDNKKYIAVGDCTGHGVPGAMMSMLGTAFLNDIVIEVGERSPEVVLNRMRIQVKKAMSSKGKKDGMDMSFCCIDGERLTVSGANLPIYIVRKNKLIEIKGDRQPIGFQIAGETPFTEREITLEKDDKVYLFSDGFADQFGGPKGKKYKYKTFREKLVEIDRYPCSDQLKLISDEFEDWKGELDQLDDVCVIGFSI